MGLGKKVFLLDFFFCLVSAATDTKFVCVIICDVTISPDIQMAFLGCILRCKVIANLNLKKKKEKIKHKSMIKCRDKFEIPISAVVFLVCSPSREVHRQSVPWRCPYAGRRLFRWSTKKHIHRWVLCTQRSRGAVGRQYLHWRPSQLLEYRQPGTSTVSEWAK